ncbi:MAG: hypothetical protein HQK78_13885 [Desulfobacterales bacterium]|nr:hypothetical protein [Desulfobacterales bacterium]
MSNVVTVIVTKFTKIMSNQRTVSRYGYRIKDNYSISYIDNIKISDDSVSELFKIDRILKEIALFESNYEYAKGLLDAIRNVQGMFIDGEFKQVLLEQVDAAEKAVNEGETNYARE